MNQGRVTVITQDDLDAIPLDECGIFGNILLKMR